MCYRHCFRLLCYESSGESKGCEHTENFILSEGLIVAGTLLSSIVTTGAHLHSMQGMVHSGMVGHAPTPHTFMQYTCAVCRSVAHIALPFRENPVKKRIRRLAHRGFIPLLHCYYHACAVTVVQQTHLLIAQLTLHFRSGAVLSSILGPSRRRSALNNVYSCT